MIFFGARHSNDPTDAQWPTLEKHWKAFLDNGNKQRIVLYEQGPLDIGALSKKEALQQNGESGLVVWLAAQSGIPTEWPEPDQVNQVTYLKKQGYDDASIMSYYFARQMLQWITRDYLTADDWRAYAESCIRNYESLGCWEETLTLEKALEWFKRVSEKDFDIKDGKAMYRLSDPSQSKISAASGQCRDERLLEVISSNWNNGTDIFVVYGSGHAIALEPVVQELTGRSN